MDCYIATRDPRATAQATLVNKRLNERNQILKRTHVIWFIHTKVKKKQNTSMVLEGQVVMTLRGAAEVSILFVLIRVYTDMFILRKFTEVYTVTVLFFVFYT